MERNIVTTLHRRQQPIRVRSYVRLDTAIPRATQLAIMDGQPGDVVTIHHAVTGLEIGSIKVSIRKGEVRLKTAYAWEQ
jgi:hypothetical protein